MDSLVYKEICFRTVRKPITLPVSSKPGLDRTSLAIRRSPSKRLHGMSGCLGRRRTPKHSIISAPRCCQSFQPNFTHLHNFSADTFLPFVFPTVTVQRRFLSPFSPMAYFPRECVITIGGQTSTCSTCPAEGGGNEGGLEREGEEVSGA